MPFWTSTWSTAEYSMHGTDIMEELLERGYKRPICIRSSNAKPKCAFFSAPQVWSKTISWLVMMRTAAKYTVATACSFAFMFQFCWRLGHEGVLYNGIKAGF